MSAGIVEFRLAHVSDLRRVQGFIDTHWRQGHILARDDRLLRWQHLGADGRLNFVLAERNSEIDGVLGFLTTRHFDSTATIDSVSLALWATRTDRPTTGIGVGLIRFLVRELNPPFVSTIGVAVDAQKMLGALGFKVGEMAHHAIFNEAFAGARVALGGRPSGHLRPDPTPSTSVVEVDAADLSSVVAQIHREEQRAELPEKTSGYLLGRFVQHPYYRYFFLLIRERSIPIGLIVCRRIDHEASSIVRCVDVVGRLPEGGLAPAIAEVLRRMECEYLDLVHHGLDPAQLESNGMVDVRSGLTSVPGFFEPFVNEPRTLRFAYRQFGHLEARVRLFLADCDQDRPNVIRND